MRLALSIALLILSMETLALCQKPRPPAGTPSGRADAARALDESSAQLAQLDQIYARTAAINQQLSQLYDTLSKKAAQVGKLAEKVNAGKGVPGAGGARASAAAGTDSLEQLLNATKAMQETQMSFNLQYLQLQSQMQNENREYTTVSNILKTKHDTVKNSINNIR